MREYVPYHHCACHHCACCRPNCCYHDLRQNWGEEYEGSYQSPRSQATAACSATRRPRALIMPEMVCGCLSLERNSSTKVLAALLFRRRRPFLYQHRRPFLYHRRPLYLGRHETGRDQKKIGRIGRRIESTAFGEKMADAVDGDWSCILRWIILLHT